MKQVCLYFLFFSFWVAKIQGQETLPIYTDYLSDNVYLVHPAAAGVGFAAKLRFTARQHWVGIPNAPSLQTASYHTRINPEAKTALGIVLFNDKNGFHSQQGFKGTYAFHLPLSKGVDFQQLSFAISYGFVQNQSDQSSFFGDPAVSQIIESTNYFTSDVGLSYHLGGFSSYFTIKNLLVSAKSDTNIAETLNLKNYIVTLGYYYEIENFMKLEPSVMFQFKELTGERVMDINLKAYHKVGNALLWGAISYRKNLENEILENLQYLSPVLGVNFQNFMFSYTYTHQLNNIVLSNAGFHQISIGFDFLRLKPRATACPNINGIFTGF